VICQSILCELDIYTSLATRERLIQTSPPKSSFRYVSCKPPMRRRIQWACHFITYAALLSQKFLDLYISVKWLQAWIWSC